MEFNRVMKRRLREADADELDRIFERLGDELEATAVEQVFRNPFLAARHVDLVARIPALVASYAVRRALVGHPRTPRPLALLHVGGLYWSDLIRVSIDTRLHPLVRRAADLRLLERLPGLATGERISIARRCSPRVVQQLRKDAVPAVISALLENPRLTEADVAQLAADEGASPGVLNLLATHRRWSVRIAVRRALCRNPALPVNQAVRLLANLAPGELGLIANDARLAPAVRHRARELMAGRSVAGGSTRGD